MMTYLHKAAVALGFSEPISIEPDYIIWVGPDNDRQYLTEKEQKSVLDLACKLQNDALDVTKSARAKLKALGLTDDEIAALVG